LIQPNIDSETVNEIYSATWIDQAALDNEIFVNGFELGSTTAWTDTQP